MICTTCDKLMLRVGYKGGSRKGDLYWCFSCEKEVEDDRLSVGSGTDIVCVADPRGNTDDQRETATTLGG